jgi:uncharacterized phiE125 gp8 family phage protein
MVTINGDDFFGLGRNGWVPPKIFNKVEDLILSPSTPAVTLAEIKSDLKIDYTDEDTFITELITLCQSRVESYTGVSCGTRSVQAILNNHEGWMEIPYGPVQSITSAVDKEGNDLIATGELVTSGIAFLKIECPRSTYINITYVAGYGGGTLTYTPLDLMKAIRLEVGYRFRFRGLEAPERGVINPGLCDDAIIYAKPFRRLNFI